MEKRQERPGGIPWVRPDESRNHSPFQSEAEVPAPHFTGSDPPRAFHPARSEDNDLPHLYENAQGCLFREDLAEFHMKEQTAATDPDCIRPLGH